MITKIDLQKHDSKIEKYFDFIFEQQDKGMEVQKLIEALSQRQRNHLAQYLDDYQSCKWHHSKIQSIKDILFNL